MLADTVNRADNQNFYGSHGQVSGAYMRLGRCTTPENLVGKTAHEAGHEFGLANCDGCKAGSSIMAPAIQGRGGDTCNAYYPGGMNGPRDCDFDAVLNSGAYIQPTPLPTLTPDCVDNDGDGYGNGTTCLGVDCDDNNPYIQSCAGGGGGCYYYSDYYYESGTLPNGEGCTNTWVVSGYVCNGVFNGWAQIASEGCSAVR